MFLERLLRFFSSLRLTVACLAFAILLVFFGTLAQVDEGLYAAQNRWFRSYFVVDAHIGWLPIPIFPGGYLIGNVLLANLLCAHASRFRFTWRKAGILVVHAGLILLLVGQLFTDMFATESSMRLTVGDSRNYSEDFHANEFVVTRTGGPDGDQVVAIPERTVARRREISHPALPVKLAIKGYWPNCALLERPPAQAKLTGATQGRFSRHVILPVPADDPQAQAAVVVDVIGDDGPLGTWLVPSRVEDPETFRIGRQQWNLSLSFAPAMGGNFLMVSGSGRSRDEQPDPIGENDLKPGREIALPHAPFKLRVREFWPSCRLYRGPTAHAVTPEITRGPFAGAIVEPLPPAKTMNDRDLPAALVEVVSPKGSLGTWLCPTGYELRQGFDLDGATYELGMRFARHYKPFSITLLEATHKKYRGTEIAKDFRSRVRVQRADTGEVRETEIYMNAPLRFAGYTFFQYQMSADEMLLRAGERPSSTFQVVRNPSWLAPYISCLVVGAGLLIQFMMHLVGFILNRKPT